MVKILIVGNPGFDNNVITQSLEGAAFSHTVELLADAAPSEIASTSYRPDIILWTSPLSVANELLKSRIQVSWGIPILYITTTITVKETVALIKIGVTDIVPVEDLHSLPEMITRALQNVNDAAVNITVEPDPAASGTHTVFPNEALLHGLLENCMEGILLTVTDGQILWANPAACSIFQMTQAEIIAAGRLPLVDLTDPNFLALMKARVDYGRAKGEIRMRRRDGTLFPAMVSTVAFSDRSGNERNSMTIRDISEHKITLQQLVITTDELNAANDSLVKIMRASQDVICSVDREGRFVQVNDASRKVWGYEPNELVGRSCFDFVYEGDLPDTFSVNDQVKDGITITHFENRYRHKNGQLVNMLWTANYDINEQLIYCTAKDITEKKKLEKAVEVERQRFMDLYNEAPSCMGVLKGPDHVYELANPLYLQLIDKKDIIGKTVLEVLPELKEQGIFELLDAVYETGEPFIANEMLIKFDFHQNGQLVDTYLNFIYQAHRGTDGTIDGILFFAINVTEQVLSRIKIEEREKHYRELIMELPVATYSCDAEGKLVIYNKAAAALWGREPEIGKELWCESWKIFKADGDFLPMDLCPMAIALKQGRTMSGMEILIEKENGERRYVLPHVVPYLDSAGKVTGAVNMLTDITEYKTAQLALKNSKKQYRQIVETTQEGIWVFDAQGKTTFVNDKMCQILECPQNEVAGKKVSDFVNYEENDFIDNISRTIQDSSSWQTQFKYITRSGKKAWAHISANAIINEEGLYEGILFMVTDITEGKKNEISLAKQNRDLIKANKELDRFVYSVSHDLRSPLTSVLGLVDIIEDESKEPETLEYVGMIKSSINRLDQFIRKILSYSQNKRTSVEVEALPIHQTIDAIIGSLQNMANAKGINFEVDIEEDGSFYSDKLRFNTIMENLISNAIKYHKTDNPGRFIKITGKADHEFFKARISDNGIGIPTQYQDKIFDMFFRISGNFEGSGIGLYIVKDTVEQLQGTIDVDSKEKVGTSFNITLKNFRSCEMN